MKTDHLEIIGKLGLTQIEAKTYLTMLEGGKSLAGNIAKRAHLHRRNTYDALEQLLQKGLSSYSISNNKKYWTAIHPEKMMSLLKEQEFRLSNILPELAFQFSGSKSKRTVDVFEGLGGMKTLFDDMIKTKAEIIMLFATGKAYAYLPHYMKRWDRELNQSKIKVKVLLNAKVDKTLYQNYKQGQIKILPRRFFTPTQIFIYGNKSCVALWSDNPLAILITDEEITSGFRRYYDFLWKFGKEVVQSKNCQEKKYPSYHSQNVP